MSGDLMILATAAASYCAPPFATEREMREIVSGTTRGKRKRSRGNAKDAMRLEQTEQKRPTNEIFTLLFDRREFLWTEAEHEALLRAYTRWTFNNVFKRQIVRPFEEFARLTEPLLAHRRLDAIRCCRIPWPNLLQLEKNPFSRKDDEKEENDELRNRF